MAYPKPLRNKLGLSIAQLADLLQCTPSLLSMTESGKRDLPTDALLVLGEIEKAMLRQNEIRTAETKLEDQHNLFLEKYARDRQHTCNQLKYKAAQLEEKYQQGMALMQMAAHFEPNATAQVIVDAQEGLEIMKRKTKIKLGRQQQERMRLQIVIAGMETEISMANQLKNNQRDTSELIKT